MKDKEARNSHPGWAVKFSDGTWLGSAHGFCRDDGPVRCNDCGKLECNKIITGGLPCTCIPLIDREDVRKYNHLEMLIDTLLHLDKHHTELIEELPKEIQEWWNTAGREEERYMKQRILNRLTSREKRILGL